MRRRRIRPVEDHTRSGSDLDRIVNAARAGDRHAFGELYTRYAGVIYAIASSRLTFDQANDVVQDVFLRALRELDTLRSATAFGSWLTAIARNAVRDVERQMRPTVTMEREQLRAGTQHEEMDARAALRAIRRLPAAYRDTLSMRLIRGMTGPEIASRTGMTPASVRVNLHRGMKLLREQLTTSRRKKTA
jgi:RNA polymerase sigma-70 factor (ECF subfamily)